MARMRTIKYQFFLNEQLAEVAPLGRLLFAGMWTLADREGRLEDRPKRIKAAVLPYDEADAEELISALASRGFLIRYEVDGERYLQIVNFLKHQTPHIQEQKSIIPPLGMHGASMVQVSDMSDESMEGHHSLSLTRTITSTLTSNGSTPLPKVSLIDADEDAREEATAATKVKKVSEKTQILQTAERIKETRNPRRRELHRLDVGDISAVLARYPISHLAKLELEFYAMAEWYSEHKKQLNVGHMNEWFTRYDRANDAAARNAVPSQPIGGASDGGLRVNERNTGPRSPTSEGPTLTEEQLRRRQQDFGRRRGPRPAVSSVVSNGVSGALS